MELKKRRKMKERNKKKIDLTPEDNYEGELQGAPKEIGRHSAGPDKTYTWGEGEEKRISRQRAVVYHGLIKRKSIGGQKSEDTKTWGPGRA